MERERSALSGQQATSSEVREKPRHWRARVSGLARPNRIVSLPQAALVEINGLRKKRRLRRGHTDGLAIGTTDLPTNWGSAAALGCSVLERELCDP